MKQLASRVAHGAMLAGLCGVIPQAGRAFVYPEHRQISLQSIQTLDSARSAALLRLWSDGRAGHELRLSPRPADPDLGDSLDYASWPAIAGDHSCSADDLLRTVLESDWILGVSRVGARLGARLRSAGIRRHERTNALRDSDLELLAVDPAYATRAGSNNVHFLLPLPQPDTDLPAYLEACLREGSELNAVGSYAWHHLRALYRARRLAGGLVPEPERSAFVRSMLADEAVALHFLQDMYAAGHVAGTWGAAPLRKGTHDYYNERGLAVKTWAGASFVLLGDAWMREEDAGRATRAVRRSLEQLLDAAGGADRHAESSGGVSADWSDDTLNVCAVNTLPSWNRSDGDMVLLTEVIQYTPIPGLHEGYGEMPRFNSELGPFLGFSTGLHSGWHRGGFLEGQSGGGFVTGVDIAFRIGLGLDGVMNESGDGLIFLDLGVSRDGASTLNIVNFTEFDEFGGITSAIPARSGYFARLRMPFWLLPFDLLVAGPILAFVSPGTLTQMGVVAINGGLIGWQSGIATSFGRFQVVLGREVGVSIYGLDKDGNRVLAYPDGVAGDLALLDVESIQLRFPVLDYRNFRVFSRDQSSALHIQLLAGVDIPTTVSVIEPAGQPAPPSRSVWFVGLRASFDWRYYF